MASIIVACIYIRFDAVGSSEEPALVNYGGAAHELGLSPEGRLVWIGAIRSLGSSEVALPCCGGGI